MKNEKAPPVKDLQTGLSVTLHRKCHTKAIKHVPGRAGACDEQPMTTHNLNSQSNAAILLPTHLQAALLFKDYLSSLKLQDTFS